ncbi:MAG: HAD family hydrolase [Anaerolineales bacterium]
MTKLDPKLIVFDWDDVITLGAKEGYFACYDFALEKIGVNLPRSIKTERILRKWGTNHREELTERLKENPGLIDESAKAFEEAFFGDVFVNSLRIIEGTVEILERLAKKYKLAVATGGHPQILRERVIPKFGIPDVFELLLSSYELEDSSKAKPDPFMINTIIEKVGVNNNETIYVGDAENDVLMARKAEVEPVVVLTGHLSKAKALQLRVNHIIRNITLIDTILQI